MKEKHPEFVARLEEEGLLYSRVIGEEDDTSSAIGRGWKSTFSTNDKEVAEQRSALSLLLSSTPVPILICHPSNL
ncbi:unnamed protein product [Linum tenue]|nr:unnamed protein product [Linum tenue]